MIFGKYFAPSRLKTRIINVLYKLCCSYFLLSYRVQSLPELAGGINYAGFFFNSQSGTLGSLRVNKPSNTADCHRSDYPIQSTQTHVIV